MLKKLCFFLAVATAVFGGELQNDIDNATNMIQNFSQIPKGVLENAQGLIMISVVKAGFLVSGRGGTGIVIAKTGIDSWSAPSAIALGGGGIGVQGGIENSDLVIVLNSQEAVDMVEQGGDLTFGLNLSVAAGPVGATAETEFVPMAYSYNMTKGLFVGLSLEGTVLSERAEANQEFYRKPVSAEEILSGRVPQPKTAKKLYKALKKYS